MTDRIGAVESKSAARQNTIYSPLDRDKWEIRIARVLAGDGELVHVYLGVMSLHDSVQCEALTHFWGDANITRPILVDAQRKDITVSLEGALCEI